MRIMSIISAVVVLALLYLVVFERDRLLGFAQVESARETAETSEVAQQEPAATAKGAVGVVALRSFAQTIDSAVILRGRTEAARQVTVAAETSGLVISEPLRKGATVSVGETLCKLDPGAREASLAEARARLLEAQGRVPEAQAAVAEANARLREAEINLNAAAQLSQDGFASETRLVSAQAAMDGAKAGVQRANSGVVSAQAGIEAAAAAVASAEREIDRLTIRAPFSGLLETDTAELGSLMQPGAPCATIIQLTPIKLVGFVPEADVNKITVGAMAGARLSTGRQIQGQVTFLSRSADDTTRTFRVEVTVPNDDLSISDGQTVEILVSSNGRAAHLLAQSTLTLDDNGVLGVRTITQGNIAKFMPVTLLRDTAEGVWVTDLPEEVTIITIGQEFVVDGVEVVPTYQEAKG
ncbi:efflux RND transporter periplasmic adaptor subunit [Yoonia sediminilitoris]|uniref:Multidrug efflux system membrane fusion protein n=1 Tax=Yoonia sediminilitoris TaxID=1286148 RepID=A0A2T6KDW1_9RHOB|nr:efflux RND transporter periplasmic adaptor subunit [Yoonia sediminilitoris]PUB13198.1 multidrug efflux system membrane fusion protein [Yoonia sediminilitoris]RCW94533.1 multidrug efflux system membrane fusion protein [Yoonia sediminilitoris]